MLSNWKPCPECDGLLNSDGQCILCDYHEGYRIYKQARLICGAKGFDVVVRLAEENFEVRSERTRKHTGITGGSLVRFFRLAGHAHVSRGYITQATSYQCTQMVDYKRLRRIFRM